MAYIGGIDNYEEQCRATIDGWKGFEVVYEKAKGDPLGAPVITLEPNAAGHEGRYASH